MNGYTYLVEKEFMEKAKPIKVDFTPLGFAISSNLELGGGGCSGCGTSENSTCG